MVTFSYDVYSKVSVILLTWNHFIHEMSFRSVKRSF